jgi:hypothetical protein
MTTKSTLQQLPAISGVFGIGLFVLSSKMVCIVVAEQGRFTLLRVGIISVVGTATTYPTKAGTNHGWDGSAVLAIPW